MMPFLSRLLAAGSLCALLGGCSLLPALSSGAPVAPGPGAGLREQVWGLTEDHRLIRFAAAQPETITRRLALRGLPPGERLLGIDYRVARGQMYALGRSGQLYTVDTDTGTLSPVGSGIGWPLLGARVGIDFNPAADRLRVVTEAGQNLRVHPDTGALVDLDPQAPGLQADTVLGYPAGDAQAGRAPRVVAAGYTYNQRDAKLTTNYAIDLGLGLLVMQGSHELQRPAVSPNSGRLSTVGPLGVPGLVEADLDISDLDNTPLAALRTDLTRLYRIDLATGQATLIGRIGQGEPLRSLAIEP